jgi:hypothetical protein
VRRCRFVGTVIVALVGALVLAASAQPAVGAAGVAVTVDRDRISTNLGEKVAFRSTIANRGSAAASGLIAHLNVLSLREGLYVDPEDWSSNRTRYLPTIPAGKATRIRWQIQAVNAGRLAVYVSVLSDTAVGRRPVNGPAVQLTVAQRKTLNSGGILPLALGMPALLGALSLGLMIRRRG